MSFFSNILDLLFPPRCAFCRCVLNTGERGMCADCELSVARVEDAFAYGRGEVFSCCVSPLYYTDTVRDSVLRFKFKERTGYAKIYGRIVAECVRQNLRGRYDLITWVPLSKARLKSRGYDQAMLLAMSTALALDNVAVETLQKHTDVPAQSGVGDAKKRRANISGVYRVPDQELVDGKRVLLIDDILTTGSTLDECARMLLDAGAREVLCATLARTLDGAELTVNQHENNRD